MTARASLPSLSPPLLPKFEHPVDHVPFTVASASLRFIALTFVAVGTGLIATQGLLAIGVVVLSSFILSKMVNSRGEEAFQNLGEMQETAAKVETYLYCTFWTTLLMAGVLTGLTGSLAFGGFYGLMQAANLGTGIGLPLLMSGFSLCLIHPCFEKISSYEKVAQNSDYFSDVFSLLHKSFISAKHLPLESTVKALLDTYKDIAYGKKLDFHNIDEVYHSNHQAFVDYFQHLLPLLNKSHVFFLTQKYPELQKIAALKKYREVQPGLFPDRLNSLEAAFKKTALPEELQARLIITYIGKEAYGTFQDPHVEAVITAYCKASPSHAPSYFQHLLPVASEEEIGWLIQTQPAFQDWSFLSSHLSKNQLNAYIRKDKFDQIEVKARSFLRIKYEQITPDDEEKCLNDLFELWEISDLLAGVSDVHDPYLRVYKANVSALIKDLESNLVNRLYDLCHTPDAKILAHWSKLTKTGLNFCKAIELRMHQENHHSDEKNFETKVKEIGNYLIVTSGDTGEKGGSIFTPKKRHSLQLGSLLGGDSHNTPLARARVAHPDLFGTPSPPKK